MDDDLKFKHAFSCIVSGPSRSGKTSFVVRFFQNLRHLCTEQKFAGVVVWCYGEKSAVPSNLYANIRIHEGVPEDFGSANSEPSLVILDDLLKDVYSKQVCELFTRGSHHRKLSVILITQNLFHQGRFCRDISLNCHYIVVFKNVRDKKQFTFVASQVYPEDSVGLYNAYLDATKEPYGYLVLDLTQNTNAYWYRDTGDMLPCDPTSGTVSALTNRGFITRWDKLSGSKGLQLFGRLHSDLFYVPLVLLPGVTFQIRFTKARPSF